LVKNYAQNGKKLYSFVVTQLYNIYSRHFGLCNYLILKYKKYFLATFVLMDFGTKFANFKRNT